MIEELCRNEFYTFFICIEQGKKNDASVLFTTFSFGLRQIYLTTVFLNSWNGFEFRRILK